MYVVIWSFQDCSASIMFSEDQTHEQAGTSLKAQTGLINASMAGQRNGLVYCNPPVLRYMNKLHMPFRVVMRWCPQQTLEEHKGCQHAMAHARHNGHFHMLQLSLSSAAHELVHLQWIATSLQLPTELVKSFAYDSYGIVPAAAEEVQLTSSRPTSHQQR